MSGVTLLGPFDENEAMNGAGFIPNSVLTRVSNAMGFLFVVAREIILIQEYKDKSNSCKDVLIRVLMWFK